MATQPIPTIGSITFFAHLLIISFDKMKHASKRVLIILSSAVVILTLTGLALLLLPHINQPKSVVITKRTDDEKTVSITDTSFVRGQELNAWLPYWDEPRVISSLKSIPKGVLNVLSPVWFKLTADGDLASTNPSQKGEISSIASEDNIKIMPTVNNELNNGFDNKRVSIVLHNSVIRSALVAKLIKTALDNGYLGWDIDWEEKNPADKQAFSNFIKYVSDEFHKQNLTLIVSVQAKSSDDDNTSAAAAEDWKTLSSSADEVRILAYDFHYDQSEAGAITPLDDLESVLDYAVKNIPNNKINLSVPLYGYDWIGSKGQSVQYQDAVDVISRYNGSTSRDGNSDELEGRYGTLINQHEVWFLDQKSVLRILYIANNYDVFKITFWRLGGEDPKVWALKK